MSYFEELPSVLAIVGSRDFPRLDKVVSFVQKLRPQTIVVSGGARGVDKTAEIAAKKNHLPIKIFPVEKFEWELAFNSWIATDLRNEIMARYVERGLGIDYNKKTAKGKIIAFWSIDPKTKKFTTGTGNMLGHAQSLHIPYDVYYMIDNKIQYFSSKADPSDEIIDLIPVREDIIRFRAIEVIGGYS